VPGQVRATISRILARHPLDLLARQGADVAAGDGDLGMMLVLPVASRGSCLVQRRGGAAAIRPTLKVRFGSGSSVRKAAMIRASS
jgi:hypothetical protein